MDMPNAAESSFFNDKCVLVLVPCFADCNVACKWFRLKAGLKGDEWNGWLKKGQQKSTAD